MVYLQLNHETNRLAVYRNGVQIFEPCSDGETNDFLSRAKLDVFQRVTEKRLIKLLRKHAPYEYKTLAHWLTISMQTLARMQNINSASHALTNHQAVIVNNVYEQLKDRAIHPSGEFDNAGRWYAERGDLISVRSPSRRFPYSQMKACRAKKYVQRVCYLYNCKNVAELVARV